MTPGVSAEQLLEMPVQRTEYAEATCVRQDIPLWIHQNWPSRQSLHS